MAIGQKYDLTGDDLYVNALYANNASNLTSNTSTTSTTLTVAQISGGSQVNLLMSGTLGGAANAQLPTAAALAAVVPVGSVYNLIITNNGAGAFAWTVTTNTGWTLTGTMSIAQNTWREFIVNVTGPATATLTSVATGTYS